jgi:alpha-tubulin suppressor-like RCC1 family protein
VPADATNVIVPSIDSDDAVAIRADGSLVSWGGISMASNFPAHLTNAVSVAAGPGFALAVSNGVPLLWGSSQGGPIYPVPPDLTNVVAVAANTCPVVLRADSTVAWWYPYEAVLTNAIAVAAGDGFGLGLRPNGTVAAWGFDLFGFGMLDIPPGLTSVVAVAAGAFFGMALKADGTVVAWGQNGDGQTNVPPDLTNAVAIAAGVYHCLALRSDGTVLEWGYNPYEHTWDHTGPTNLVSLLTNVVSIAAGGYSSIAVIGTGMPPAHVVVTNVTFGASGLRARVPSDRAKVYALEYKDSLADAQWTLLLPLAVGTGSDIDLVDTNAAARQRFYRVRRW